MSLSLGSFHKCPPITNEPETHKGGTCWSYLAKRCIIAKAIFHRFEGPICLKWVAGALGQKKTFWCGYCRHALGFGLWRPVYWGWGRRVICHVIHGSSSLFRSFFGFCTTSIETGSINQRRNEGYLNKKTWRYIISNLTLNVSWKYENPTKIIYSLIAPERYFF